MMTKKPYKFTKSKKLWAKAQTLIPGGSQGTRQPECPQWPLYFDRAKGCRMWDVDGNEYGSTLNSVLGAFDSSFSLLTSSDDDAAPGETASADSYAAVPLPADGVLYAAVTSFPDSDFDGTDGTTIGSYSLWARCFGEAEEPNDNFATAATYPCASSREAFIYPLTDVDYYADKTAERLRRMLVR